MGWILGLVDWGVADVSVRKMHSIGRRFKLYAASGPGPSLACHRGHCNQ